MDISSSLIAASIEGSAQKQQQAAAIHVEKLTQDIEASTAKQLIAVAEQSAPQQQVDPSNSVGLNIDVYA